MRPFFVGRRVFWTATLLCVSGDLMKAKDDAPVSKMEFFLYRPVATRERRRKVDSCGFSHLASCTIYLFTFYSNNTSQKITYSSTISLWVATRTVTFRPWIFFWPLSYHAFLRGKKWLISFEGFRNLSQKKNDFRFTSFIQHRHHKKNVRISTISLSLSRTKRRRFSNFFLTIFVMVKFCVCGDRENVLSWDLSIFNSLSLLKNKTRFRIFEFRFFSICCHSVQCSVCGVMREKKCYYQIWAHFLSLSLSSLKKMKPSFSNFFFAFFLICRSHKLWDILCVWSDERKKRLIGIWAHFWTLSLSLSLSLVLVFEISFFFDLSSQTVLMRFFRSLSLSLSFSPTQKTCRRFFSVSRYHISTTLRWRKNVSESHCVSHLYHKTLSPSKILKKTL